MPNYWNNCFVVVVGCVNFVYYFLYFKCTYFSKRYSIEQSEFPFQCFAHLTPRALVPSFDQLSNLEPWVDHRLASFIHRL